MKKRVFGRKLSRSSGSRRSLKRSLIGSLVEHGSIKTTKVRAKFVLRDLDKLINMAKKDNLAARRRVDAVVGNSRKVAEGIFIAAKSFSDQKGGYVKVTSLGRRKGDNTEMVTLEWTKPITQVLPKPKTKKTKTPKIAEGKPAKSLRQKLTRKKSVNKR